MLEPTFKLPLFLRTLSLYPLFFDKLLLGLCIERFVHAQVHGHVHSHIRLLVLLLVLRVWVRVRVECITLLLLWLLLLWELWMREITPNDTIFPLRM